MKNNGFKLTGKNYKIDVQHVEGAVPVERPFDALNPERIYKFEHIVSKNIFVGRGIIRNNLISGRVIRGLSTEFAIDRKVECVLPEYLVAQGAFVIVKEVCYRHKKEGYCSKCADDELKDNQV